MPVGLLVPLATSLRFIGGVAACEMLSVAFQVLQLAAGRSLDIDEARPSRSSTPRRDGVRDGVENGTYPF